MTSNRDQNVFVLQRSDDKTWEPSMTIFTDSGGNLQSAPQKISLKTDRNAFKREKSFRHSSSPNFSKSAFPNKARNSTNKHCKALITNRVSSSSNWNSTNRELSPVRWCDREVDGVYLGKSGWVQVQQRSLDDCRSIVYSVNSGFSTLPSKRNSLESNPNSRFDEKKGRVRPLNLPLSTKKYIFRDNHERPFKFIQEFDSSSPPSVTPIISPPPAFKDDGSEALFPKQSLGKSSLSKISFSENSEVVADSTSLPDFQIKKSDSLNLFSSAKPTEFISTTVSAVKHQRLDNPALNTKFLENDYSQKISCDKRLDTNAPLSVFDFKSLENGIMVSKGVEVTVSDSFYKKFVNSEKESDKEEVEHVDDGLDEGNKRTVIGRSFLELQSSSCDELSEPRFSSKAFSPRSFQGSEKQIFVNEYCNTYRTRSSSLDSDSSSISSCSSSISSSSSFKVEKSGQKCSQKVNSKQSLKKLFKVENAQAKNYRHFNIKRSKSLQLSKKKSLDDSLLLNNFLSEKPRDPILPEYLTSQTKNRNEERPAPLIQRLRHVLVTVNGESIPVSDSQSLKSLNKITASEAEQKKLIVEVKKEAKIISEFMNRSRSREAARNLLLDRYINRIEDGGLILRCSSPENDHDTCFRMTNQNLQSKQICPIHFPPEKSNKKSQLHSWSPDVPRHPATYPVNFTSLSLAYSQASSKNQSCLFFCNNQDQRKVEQVKNKKNGTIHLEYAEQTDDSRSKRKWQNLNFPFDWTCSNSETKREKPRFFSSQKQNLRNAKGQNFKKITIDFRNVKNLPKVSVKNFSMKRGTGIKEKSVSHNAHSAFEENSSSFTHIFNSNSEKTLGASALLKKYTADSNSKTRQELFRSRPRSTSERDLSVSKEVDKRSLSLPRSFLSECYGWRNSYQRDLSALKQQPLEISDEVSGGCRLYSQDYKTALTMPVCDIRFDRSSESLNQIPNVRSHSDETTVFKSRRLIRQKSSMKKRLNSSFSTVLLEQFKRSAAKSNERNIIPTYKSSLKISVDESDTVLRKLKKKLSLKHTEVKEHSKVSSEGINRDSEETVENSHETLSVGSGEICLQPFEIDYCDISELTHRFIKKNNWKKGKYDSHDSGIQILNRGNLDNSESQDTDIQEDVDCAFASDVQGQIKFKKQNIEKIVRRSYSDFGNQRLFNWSLRNYKRIAKNFWRLHSLENPTIFNKYKKFLKPELRRSLSQPLGLNELSQHVRRQPSTLKEFALSEYEENIYQRINEEESLSDSETLVTSLRERKKVFDFAPRALAEAIWDHVAIDSYELPFEAGDVIEVLDRRDQNLWLGAASENIGYFPSAFVRALSVPYLLEYKISYFRYLKSSPDIRREFTITVTLCVSQADTVKDCFAEMTKGKNASIHLRRNKGLSLLSYIQVRSRIVRELLNTERDFVKILRDVKDGYIIQCKRMTDMFTPAQITAIFSNLEDLLVFQETFLKNLEKKMDREFPYKSCIGEVFLNHVSGFRMYSEYCNSYPVAIATLQGLYQENKYCKFFETCRLKHSLIEISLDGYLLTPVQRICKYPLQLGELLKYTRSDHPDYKNVEAALEAMRNVAILINERKRKMESLEKLVKWQQKVEGWEGEDLIEISSQLIHQGDVIKVTSGRWTSSITLFLFDHQIIYCKKDLLKKNAYIYKGRISLEESDVIDLPDGKNQHFGVHIKYGLKISTRFKDKWLVFCCRSSEDKFQWLEALAAEKRLVAQDKERGLDLPTAAKQLAKMVAQTKNNSPRKPKSKNKFSPNCEELLCRNIHPSTSKTKSTRRISTWFTFGGVMKNSKASLRSRIPLHRLS